MDGSFHVRRHTVPHRNDARWVDLITGQRVQRFAGKCVDRRMGFARNAHLAAEFDVELRERPSAIDHSLAPLHNDVRIGANHRHVTGGECGEPVAVIVGRFLLVMKKTGEEEVVALILTVTRHIETGEKWLVTF